MFVPDLDYVEGGTASFVNYLRVFENETTTTTTVVVVVR